MKKVLFTLLSLATLGIGIAIPFQAKAESIHFGHPHSGFSFEFGDRVHRQYEVYYRDDRYDEWHFAGSYRHWEDADYAARKLERRGYMAQIETRLASRW
jgi:hypothetical protein